MAETPDAFLKRQTGKESGNAQKLIRFAVSLRYMAALLLIVQSWFLALIVYGLIFQQHDLANHYGSLALLLAAAALRFGFSVLGDRLSIQAAADIQHRLRCDLYRHVNALGPTYITKEGSGALLSSLSDGINALGPYYSQYLPARMLMLLVPLSILIVVFPFDWLSGITMLFTAPMIPLFMILIGKGAENLNQKQWRELARMSNHFLDVLQGLTTLKLFNASRRAGDMISTVAEDYRRETMKVLRLAFLSSVTLEFFSTVSIALIAVFIGFRLMWGEMDFLPGFFILLLAPEFYLPLRRMGTAYHARMEAIGAAEKIQAVLESTSDSTSEEKTAQAAESSKKSAPAIRLHDLYFTYPDGRTALNGLDMILEPGKTYALTGPSGAGKSTILSLLLGFIAPTQGQVLINDSPLDSLDLASYRERIAWIPQTPTIFYGSVMDNIRLGNQDATDEEVKDLCRSLVLDAFISNLPQGYDTRIGEQGFGLSGGQARRIAIARAFLRDAPLLLMDEPTASLDLETERLLQHAMEHLACDKTVLIVAHRLHTVRHAEQIFYMNDGRIEQHGSHEALLKTCPDYAALVQQQMLQDRTKQQEKTA